MFMSLVTTDGQESIMGLSDRARRKNKERKWVESATPSQEAQWEAENRVELLEVMTRLIAEWAVLVEVEPPVFRYDGMSCGVFYDHYTCNASASWRLDGYDYRLTCSIASHNDFSGPRDLSMPYSGNVEVKVPRSGRSWHGRGQKKCGKCPHFQWAHANNLDELGNSLEYEGK